MHCEASTQVPVWGRRGAAPACQPHMRQRWRAAQPPPPCARKLDAALRSSPRRPTPAPPRQIFNFALSNSFTTVDLDRLQFPAQYKARRCCCVGVVGLVGLAGKIFPSAVPARLLELLRPHIRCCLRCLGAHPAVPSSPPPLPTRRSTMFACGRTRARATWVAPRGTSPQSSTWPATGTCTWSRSRTRL